MNRWNEASQERPMDRWIARSCAYLRGRTADHWLMFAGGLLLGALLG